ncbi:MAG TPA: SIS domain-containing protein [Anaerolineaceae bacterium]|nr:SIS domain-containing protein [Anaerolineaceae bacterium]
MQEIFFDKIEEILHKIRETQSESISTIAKKLSDILINGGIVYTFGAGHSHMLSEEIAGRAGGLMQVRAILEPELTEIQGRGKSTQIERMPGYAKIVYEANAIRKKDALIVISNSGRNPVPVEMAEEAKKADVLVIALTNLEHSKSVTSRCPSGKKLYEVCDYVLDNCGVTGDAAIEVRGKPYSIGSTSTVAGAIILQALVVEIIGILLQKGNEPAILMSGNLDGTDEYNQKIYMQLISKYPELLYMLDVWRRM